MIHVNPVATDGFITIGYDSNDVAGSWPGDMAETCELDEFFISKEGDLFYGSELYRVEIRPSGFLRWRIHQDSDR